MPQNTLSDREVRRIAKVVIEYERRVGIPFEKRDPPLVDQPAGLGLVEFKVTSASTVDDSDSPFDGMRKLVVEIVGPSCNKSSLHGDTVDVYEHDPQCLTADELDAALVDRKGWAYQGVFQDQSATAEAGDLTPCHWVLFGLCCP